MSDSVLIALIVAVGATTNAVIGLRNGKKSDAIAVNVDGNLNEVKAELATLNEKFLALTVKASHAEGKLEGL